jgi:hypothetical protein
VWSRASRYAHVSAAGIVGFRPQAAPPQASGRTARKGSSQQGTRNRASGEPATASLFGSFAFFATAESLGHLTGSRRSADPSEAVVKHRRRVSLSLFCSFGVLAAISGALPPTRLELVRVHVSRRTIRQAGLSAYRETSRKRDAGKGNRELCEAGASPQAERLGDDRSTEHP